MRDGRLVADQGARAVAEHRLFFSQDEGHRTFPRNRSGGVHHPGARQREPESGGSRSGAPCRPERERAAHAPGKPRIRLATIPSITSLVPPSMEFAFVRSQALARVPSRERGPSHSSASIPPAAIRISWRRLLSSVPKYFMAEEKAGCARSALARSIARSAEAASAAS